MAAKSTESMLGLPSPDFNLQYSTNLRHSKRGGRLFGCTLHTAELGFACL